MYNFVISWKEGILSLNKSYLSSNSSQTLYLHVSH